MRSKFYLRVLDRHVLCGEVRSAHCTTSSELHPTTLGSKTASSSHTVLEGIDKFESGLNKSIYTKYSIKFCIDSRRKIYLKPALRIMAT
jgi:hypothetical protein